jgi:hypothetical protein
MRLMTESSVVKTTGTVRIVDPVPCDQAELANVKSEIATEKDA